MDDLLSIQEVMKLLKMSRPTVDKLIHSGEIRASKMGRQWRVQRRDLRAYVESCVVVPEAEDGPTE